MRPIRLMRRPRPTGAVVRASLLLLLVVVAAASPLKSTRLLLPLGHGSIQRQHQPAPSRKEAAKPRHHQTPPSPLAFQAVTRRVMQLNNGTRLALAGALAGGFSNLVLYPIDLAKTLRQAGPASASATLWTQARAYGLFSLWAGLTPAILGSMPSSALYFGVYEQVKRRLARRQAEAEAAAAGLEEGGARGFNKARRASILRRWGVHAVAAAAGNTASSLIFVPKEVLKQQLQTYRNRGGAGNGATLPYVLGQILKERGIVGLYSGYRATLLRNIPSAILRFALYEEFKLAINAHEWLRAHKAHIVAGALAGAISSALTTPLDVVKTRMAVNACPAGGDVLSCLVSVAQSEGVNGLYAGLGFRVLYSALFTSVGFASFEASKALLGVQDPPVVATAAVVDGAKKSRAGNSKGKPQDWAGGLSRSHFVQLKLNIRVPTH